MLPGRAAGVIISQHHIELAFGHGPVLDNVPENNAELRRHLETCNEWACPTSLPELPHKQRNDRFIVVVILPCSSAHVVLPLSWARRCWEAGCDAL